MKSAAHQQPEPCRVVDIKDVRRIFNNIVAFYVNAIKAFELGRAPTQESGQPPSAAAPSSFQKAQHCRAEMVAPTCLNHVLLRVSVEHRARKGCN